MKNYEEKLLNSALFKNIDPQDAQELVTTLKPFTKHYLAGEMIFHPNQCISTIGLILEGSIHISKDDYWGNHTILAEFDTGDFFGEVYAITSIPLGNSVESITPSEILFMDLGKIIEDTTFLKAKNNFIANLVNELALKNLLLFKKIDVLSQKSTRKKILAYLTQLSLELQLTTFEIPFNRQALADYLCVDRSALSNELSKLRSEGYIDFKKNKFTLKKHNNDYFGQSQKKQTL